MLTDREKTMTSNSGEARSFSAMYLPRSPKPAMAIILRVLGIGSIAMRSCVVFLGGRAAHGGYIHELFGPLGAFASIQRQCTVMRCICFVSVSLRVPCCR